MGKTLPADDVPETPCRSSFRYRGQTVVVTMMTPNVPPNTIPIDGPYWWPDTKPVDKPTIVPGLIVPATFTVTGLPVPVVFGTRITYQPGPPPSYLFPFPNRRDEETELIRRPPPSPYWKEVRDLVIGPPYLDERPWSSPIGGAIAISGSPSFGFAISQLTVDTSTTVPKTLDLPLEALTRAAVQASTARAVLLPKNYKALTPTLSDPMTWVTTDADRPPAGVPMIVTDNEPTPWPIHVGPLSAAEDASLLARLFGVGSSRRTSITEDVLRETADVYRNATSDPRLAVAAHFQVSPSTARERIRKARERGLLEDIPDTDGRKARRKGS